MLGGEAFGKLVAATHATCPSVHVAHLTPSGLLDIEDMFREKLSPPRRRRLDAVLPRAADGGTVACENRDGASCEVAANLRGLRRAGLMQAFVRRVCTPGVVR